MVEDVDRCWQEFKYERSIEVPRKGLSGAKTGKTKSRQTQKPAENSGEDLTPKLNDIQTWTDRLGRTKLRTFTDNARHFWLEQNAAKASQWAKLARQGHQIAWEFDKLGGSYTGRLLIDGEIMTPSEATKKFLRKQ